MQRFVFLAHSWPAGTIARAYRLNDNARGRRFRLRNAASEDLQVGRTPRPSGRVGDSMGTETFWIVQNGTIERCNAFVKSGSLSVRLQSSVEIGRRRARLWKIRDERVFERGLRKSCRRQTTQICSNLRRLWAETFFNVVRWCGNDGGSRGPSTKKPNGRQKEPHFLKNKKKIKGRRLRWLDSSINRIWFILLPRRLPWKKTAH